jgi:hypothetical protein
MKRYPRVKKIEIDITIQKKITAVFSVAAEYASLEWGKIVNRSNT